MAIVFWFVLAVLALIAGMFIAGLRFSTTMEPASRQRAILAMIFIGVIWLSPLYYEFPDQYSGRSASIVVTFEGNTIHYHRYGSFCWEFGHDCSNLPIKPIRVFVSTPVADSKLYRVFDFYVTISDPQLFYSDPAHRLISAGSTDDGFVETAKSVQHYRAKSVTEVEAAILYKAVMDFYYQHGTELEQFNRPLRGEEQYRFRELLAPAVTPPLKAAGIDVQVIGFFVSCSE